MFGISAGLEGYAFGNTGFLNATNASLKAKGAASAIERLIFIGAGLCCIIPETKSDIIGLALIVVLVVLELLRKKKN